MVREFDSEGLLFFVSGLLSVSLLFDFFSFYSTVLVVQWFDSDGALFCCFFSRMSLAWPCVSKPNYSTVLVVRDFDSDGMLEVNSEGNFFFF